MRRWNQRNDHILSFRIKSPIIYKQIVSFVFKANDEHTVTFGWPFITTNKSKADEKKNNIFVVVVVVMIMIRAKNKKKNTWLKR